MPIARRTIATPVVFVLIAASALMPVTGIPAQVVDSARARSDSLRIVTDTPLPLSQSAQVVPAPPISPGRAFFTSLLLPGLGQSRLDRGSAGALFATVEFGALAMIRRTAAQVRDARSFYNDSLPTDFNVGSDGTLQPAGRSEGSFSNALVNRRKLHMEDWIAVLAFNHLLSGADAFVSAQLWDLPMAVSVYPNSSGGSTLVATIRW